MGDPNVVESDRSYYKLFGRLGFAEARSLLSSAGTVMITIAYSRGSPKRF